MICTITFDGKDKAKLQCEWYEATVKFAAEKTKEAYLPVSSVREAQEAYVYLVSQHLTDKKAIESPFYWKQFKSATTGVASGDDKSSFCINTSADEKDIVGNWTSNNHENCTAAGEITNSAINDLRNQLVAEAKAEYLDKVSSDR